MWEQLKRIIKPNGAIVLFGSEPFSSLLRVSNLKMYKYDWVWDKVKTTGFGSAKYQPLRQHEIISVFYKKANYFPIMTDKEKVIDNRNWNNSGVSENGRFNSKVKERKVYDKSFPKTIIEYNSANAECNNTKRLHPTQKPVALLEYLIKTYTQEGETVLDFTMGSGSTGVACLNTNRRFIGIEMDEKYFDIAANRISDCSIQSS